MKVYTVTVIDLVEDPVLGIRRTPVIFTSYHSALYTVKNNEMDLADNNSYQYAVIEETELNIIRPHTSHGLRTWFSYNAVTDEFEVIDHSRVPIHLLNMYGFGIG